MSITTIRPREPRAIGTADADARARVPGGLREPGPSRRDRLADDLDAQIARAEAVLMDLKRQKATRDARALLVILARIIPVGVVFSVEELIAHAALDRALAQAIGTTSPIALGRRLARLARRADLAGVQIECLGRDKGGVYLGTHTYIVILVSRPSPVA